MRRAVPCRVTSEMGRPPVMTPRDLASKATATGSRVGAGAAVCWAEVWTTKRSVTDKSKRRGTFIVSSSGGMAEADGQPVSVS